MTLINATQVNLPITIGQNSSILPNVTIDESSVTYSSTQISGKGQVFYGLDNYQVMQIPLV